MSALMSEVEVEVEVDTLTPGPALSVSTVEARLEELRAEHANGCRQLSRLDRQREELVATLERIDGAITVLGELLDPLRLAATPKPG